jgi:hypothetical protein
MPTGDLLGLASPIAFGSRDFLGEVGSRRLSYWWVTAWLSKPGNGVSHPTHMERFEIPGMTMLGRRGIASSPPGDDPPGGGGRRDQPLRVHSNGTESPMRVEILR